jgi:hypothetical protein
VDATAGELKVQDPVACVKPEPEKVIVAPIEPELGLNVTVAAFTINGTDVVGVPITSVKVMKYVFAAIFAT